MTTSQGRTQQRAEPATPATGALATARSFRKRVWVVLACVVALFSYSVAAEGVAGIVTFLAAMVLIPVFWMAVWHLKLKHIKVFQDIATVLFQLEDKKETKRPSKAKIVRVD